MCGKVLVASEKNKQLDLDSSSGVMFFFGHTQILVVFIQVRVWDRKSAGQGGHRLEVCECRAGFNFAGRRECTNNFNPRMTLKQPLPYRTAFEVCA